MAYGQTPSEKSLQNLDPGMSKKTEEERKAVQRRGGIASGRARREKRTFKQLLEIAMSEMVEDSKTHERKPRKEVSAIMLATKCARGDLRAIALARDILGEVTTQKVEVTGKDGQDLIPPARRLSEDEVAKYIEQFNKEY